MKFSTTAFLLVVGSGWISAFVPIHQKKVVTPSTFITRKRRINKCNLNAAVSNNNSDSDKLQELRDASRSIETKRLSFEKELREFKEELDLLNESKRTLQQQEVNNVNRNSNDDNSASTGVTLTSSTDTARGFDGTKYKEIDHFSLKDSYERASHPNVFRTVIPKRQEGQKQNNSVRFGMDYEQKKEEEVMEADMSHTKKEGHNARLITIAATAACLSFFSPSSNNKNLNTKQDSSSGVSTSVATKATTPTSPITPFSFLSQKSSSNKEITKNSTPSDSSTNNGGVMKMLFPNPPSTSTSTSTSEVREAGAQVTAATREDETVVLSSQTSPTLDTSEFEEMQDKIRELRMQKEEILKALNTLRQEDEVSNLVSPSFHKEEEELMGASATDVSPSLSESIARTEKKEVKPSTERNSIMGVLFPNPPERSTVPAVSTATEVIDDSSNPTFQSSSLLFDDQTTLDFVSMTAETDEVEEKVIEPFNNVVQSTEDVDSPAQELQDTTPVESIVTEAIDDSSTVIPPVIPTSSSSLFDDQTTLDSVSLTAETDEVEEKVMGPLENVLAQSTEDVDSPAQETQATASVALSQEMKVTDTDPSLELDTVKEVTPFASEEEEEGEAAQLQLFSVSQSTDEIKVPYEELSPTIVTGTFMEEGSDQQETSPTSTKSTVSSSSSSSSFESFVNKVKSKSDDDESISNINKVKQQQEGGKVSIIFPASSKFDTVPMKMNNQWMSNLHPLVGVTAAIGVSVGVTGAKNRNLFSRQQSDGNSSFSSSNSNDFKTGSSEKSEGENEGEENVVSESFSLLQELDDTSTQQNNIVDVDENDKKEKIIYGDYYKTQGPIETYADSLSSSKTFATSTSTFSSMSPSNKSFPKVGISGYADSLSSSKYHQVQDEIMAAIQADEKISSLEQKIKSLANLSDTDESKGENLVP